MTVKRVEPVPSETALFVALRRALANKAYTCEQFGPDYLAAIPTYLASEAAGHVNGCIFGSAGAFFSYWAAAKESAIYNRDWDNYGPWTVDEVEKCMPNLLKGYVNPAPPEKEKK